MTHVHPALQACAIPILKLTRTSGVNSASVYGKMTCIVKRTVPLPAGCFRAASRWRPFALRATLARVRGVCSSRCGIRVALRSPVLPCCALYFPGVHALHESESSLISDLAIPQMQRKRQNVDTCKKERQIVDTWGVECFSFLTCCARGQILQNRCFGTLRPHKVIHGAISALITHKSNCVS